MEVFNKEIERDQCLTINTAESLRVTLHSTIELCEELLELEHKRKKLLSYILTAKMNQDPLEVCFLINNN